MVKRCKACGVELGITRIDDQLYKVCPGCGKKYGMVPVTRQNVRLAGPRPKVRRRA
jgi:hypothetical protein